MITIDYIKLTRFFKTLNLSPRVVCNFKGDLVSKGAPEGEEVAEQQRVHVRQQRDERERTQRQRVRRARARGLGRGQPVVVQNGLLDDVLHGVCGRTFMYTPNTIFSVGNVYFLSQGFWVDVSLDHLKINWGVVKLQEHANLKSKPAGITIGFLKNVSLKAILLNLFDQSRTGRWWSIPQRPRLPDYGTTQLMAVNFSQKF